MGFVKKEKMCLTEGGKPYTVIGKYLVVKNSENMTGIYLEYHNEANLVTSKPKWSQAIKLAKLLSEAYEVGYEDAKDFYDTRW